MTTMPQTPINALILVCTLSSLAQDLQQRFAGPAGGGGIQCAPGVLRDPAHRRFHCAARSAHGYGRRRLDADLSETDGQPRPILFGKVDLVAAVGNEDGAHQAGLNRTMDRLGCRLLLMRLHDQRPDQALVRDLSHRAESQISQLKALSYEAWPERFAQQGHETRQEGRR